MTNVNSSSISVKASNFPQTQESGEGLTETRLTWLEGKCSDIQKSLLGMQDPVERSNLERQFALLRVLLQRQINLSGNNNVQSKAQALADSILHPEFVRFTNEELKKPDAQAHVDCLAVELTSAFEEANDQLALSCLVKLEDLRLHTVCSSEKIRQFPLTKLPVTTALFDNLYKAIQTGDYAENPVTELYGFLQTLSPQVISAFCKRLEKTVPSKLQSLQDTSTKLKILYGILLPQQTDQAFPEEIQACVNQLVVEQGTQLMNDMIFQMDCSASQIKEDLSDYNDSEMYNSLDGYFCSLSQEDLLAQIACRVPALHTEYQRYLVSRLANELNSGFFREETMLRYRLYKQFVEKEKLAGQDIPPSLASELTKAFDKYLLIILIDLDETRHSSATIFRVAKICETMKELFSISGSDLPKPLFKKIKTILSIAKSVGKEERELMTKLPLSQLQKDSLFQALLT
jgi:hypothetical protein